MNRTNGVPRIGAERDGFLYDSCTMPVPIQSVARSEGGLQQDSAMVCNTTLYPYVIVSFMLVSDSPAGQRPIQRKRAGRERPPLFCRCIGTGGGGGLQQGLQHHPPPFWRVAPVRFIPAGRLRTLTPSGR